MRNFQDIFEKRKRSFISAFSISVNLPLIVRLFLPGVTQCSEAYSEPSHMSMMKLFMKNNERLKAFNHFRIKLFLRCLAGFLIRLCMSTVNKLKEGRYKLDLIFRI